VVFDMKSKRYKKEDKREDRQEKKEERLEERKQFGEAIKEIRKEMNHKSQSTINKEREEELEVLRMIYGPNFK
jgi:uncharacterized protein (UPF0218 family)